ncbi:SRPBCC domain-containing protein [Maritimibacter sp. DP1N21-5]|uniref:SRPBCC domain-containing protein n=1 Tax=Maritimibacter sp. DP1N21-5 TaxID=2836867 RepID=UPI001C4670E3|nr:SRPBCC domain-containing protein [Maritimibacter sp. DP1N21-5]MBV7408302.1 SRPBCC domain-containing protein [Maritimibacter sp. DP1N21-5]
MPKPLSFELNGDTQLVVTRDFDAPPAFVWRAHMEPALIKKWQNGGGDGWEVAEVDIDARVGGKYRMLHKGPDYEFQITGTFLELDEPRRVVQEEIMLLPDPTPPNVVETLFNSHGAGTRMVMTMTLPDAETRKQMMDTGMLDGMELSYQNLDALEIA